MKNRINIMPTPLLKKEGENGVYCYFAKPDSGYEQGKFYDLDKVIDAPNSYIDNDILYITEWFETELGYRFQIIKAMFELCTMEA